MNSWNEDDLRAIAESHDLYISPFREDGTTYGTPTLVWPLVVDGEVNVRAANGQQSSWYRAAVSQKAGPDPCRRPRLRGHLRAWRQRDRPCHRRGVRGEIQGQLSRPDHAGRRAEVGDLLARRVGRAPFGAPLTSTYIALHCESCKVR
jgi:hypothetical protein